MHLRSKLSQRANHLADLSGLGGWGKQGGNSSEFYHVCQVYIILAWLCNLAIQFSIIDGYYYYFYNFLCVLLWWTLLCIRYYYCPHFTIRNLRVRETQQVYLYHTVSTIWEVKTDSSVHFSTASYMLGKCSTTEQHILILNPRFFIYFFFLFETESCIVAPASLEFAILLPQPLE